jgi:hypothetical protein
MKGVLWRVSRVGGPWWVSTGKGPFKVFLSSGPLQDVPRGRIMKGSS